MNKSPETTREARELLIGVVLGLLRLLWSERLSGEFSQGTLQTRHRKLSAKLAAKCEHVAPETIEVVMESWMAAAVAADETVQPITFDALCQRVLPGIYPEDMRYFATRSIRRRYHLGLSASTPAAAHNLARTLFEHAGERDVSLEELNLAMKNRPRPAEYKDRIAEAGLREAFIDISLMLNLFEVSAEGTKLTLRPEVTDAEYMISHLFGVPTGIPGFDVLFGGGLMLTESVETIPKNGEPPSEIENGIDGRSILCIGPFGSGKTLLSLQFAVEIARRGGVALVMALEQTPEECLYALEAIGVSTTQSGFIVADNSTESAWALSHPNPPCGALVFLRPSAEQRADYAVFLQTVEKRLSWMARYSLRLLVVDPINALVHAEGPATSSRVATRKMFEAAKEKGVNVWFTSEHLSGEPESNHFAENIADTVIHLGVEAVLGQQKRYIEITKSRFQQEAPGRHGLVIDSEHGIHIYPSTALVAQSSALLARYVISRPSLNEVAPSFGVPGMERLLGSEPIRPGDIIAVAGPGKAKALIGIKFLLAQASLSSATTCALLISDYTNSRAERLITSVATPEEQHFASQIEKCSISTGYVDPGRILGEIKDAFDRCEKKGRRVGRVLLTNLSRWEEEMPLIAEDRAFGIALVSLVRSYGAVTLVVCGDAMERGSWLHDTMFDQADTLLQFHRREQQGRITTLVSAVQTRSMRHQREAFELSFGAAGVQLRPAPLLRLKASGDLIPVKISLFLHAETKNHQEHNDRMIGALRATVSPDVEIAKENRRFDLTLLSMAQYSAVDELQIFQLDEYQLPTAPAAVFSPEALYSFDAGVNSATLKDRLREFTEERVLCDDGKRFLAVPFYANLSFFAIHVQKLENITAQMSFERFAGSWRELAAQCKRWDEEQPDSEDLLFSCAVYENSFETYNCLFFEILYSLLPPPEGQSVDLATWLGQPEAVEAAYLLWLLCHRSHALTTQAQSYIPTAAICRHWFNTLNQELSKMAPQERAQIQVKPLFKGQTTAGEWYLAIPSYSASPEIGLRLIDQLTTSDRETLRVELGVGLPTRTAYYQDANTNKTSISRYFRFSRSDVYELFKNAIRRSQFCHYQRFSNTICSHLQAVLEIPRPKTEKCASDDSVHAEIERTIKGLAGNLSFLTQTTTIC